MTFSKELQLSEMQMANDIQDLNTESQIRFLWW